MRRFALLTARAAFYELAPWVCAAIGGTLFIICISIDPGGDDYAWLWIPFWIAVLILCLGALVGGLGWLSIGESKIGGIVMGFRIIHAIVLFSMLVGAVHHEHLWGNDYFRPSWEVAFWGFALTPGASALALIFKIWLAPDRERTERANPST